MPSVLFVFLCLRDRGCSFGCSFKSKWPFLDLAENFARDVSTICDCWQMWSGEDTVWRRLGFRQTQAATQREDWRISRMAVGHRTESSAENQASVGNIVIQRMVTNWLLERQLRARRPLQQLWCCQDRATLVVFSDERLLVPVMTVCWFKGGQTSACTKSFWALNTMGIYQDLVNSNSSREISHSYGRVLFIQGFHLI